MKSLYLLILVLLISTVSISQETKKDTLSIEGKFDLIYKTSSSYKEFKVIRKSRFQNLKNDVLDSIRKIDHELQLNNNKNTILKDSLKNVNEVLGILDLDMKLLITKKNSISFLGIQLNKSTYTITVWSIILLLIIALFYFIYQYKNSYQIILHAKKKRSRSGE
jgi:Mg2+ and Co2+ transporter CorA